MFPPFIVAQVAGELAATFFFRWLIPAYPSLSRNVLVAHDNDNGNHCRAYMTTLFDHDTI